MKTQQAIRSSSLKKNDAKSSKQVKESSSPRKSQLVKEQSKKNIMLGLCAMRKKIESKPMREILKRLACPQIKIVEMCEYLDKNYKEWPVVDALICFYSEGFPYLKAWKYVKKTKPFLINNLDKQEYLWDRTVVYEILKKARIPVAKHFMIFKDPNYIEEIQRYCFYAPQQIQNLNKMEIEQAQTPKFQSIDPSFQNMDNFLSTINRNGGQFKKSSVDRKQSIQIRLDKNKKNSQIQKQKFKSKQKIQVQSQQKKQIQKQKKKQQVQPHIQKQQIISTKKIENQKKCGDTALIKQALKNNKQVQNNSNPIIVQKSSEKPSSLQNQIQDPPKVNSLEFISSQKLIQRQKQSQVCQPNSLTQSKQSSPILAPTVTSTGSTKLQKKPTLRKQTFDLIQSFKLDYANQRNQWNQQIKEAQTAKRPMRDLSEFRPCTLRKFHQERLSNIETFQVEEVDDEIIIRGKQKVHKLKKPFVEKPFYAQNHQICIYYPQSMGGGRKMLFRKNKNSSSAYQPNQNKIRRDGNYIYQQYLPNNAFDIKVYTIGQYYMYAEARKSPTLDGVVQRDELGKEKRFPIILTPEEKFIAKKIVHEFGQQVCGFDLLRANGKSYVCDVNGWSFVKSNPKYWTDCAKILQKKLFHRFLPHLIQSQSKIFQKFNISSDFITPSARSLNLGIPYKQEQLRSIVSIFRHGDRSPKLKLKFKTSEPKFIQFFTNQKLNEIKIKDANSLTKFLETTLEVIGENPNMKNSDLTKLVQMKTVLQSGGHFQGLNRKCQLKVIGRDQDQKINKILIVFKWGGQLSVKGTQDAVQLGKKMRMQKYNDDQDFLSLHSSYRHDLKTYSSDEGRCIKTAASFLKGFLNIEGGLAPIITSMVMTNKKAQNLLDCTSEQNHSPLSQKIVKKLSDMLNSGQNLVQMYQKEVRIQEVSPQMLRIMKQIGTPRQKLKMLHKGILQLTLQLQTAKIAQISSSDSSEQMNRASGVSAQDQQKQDVILIYQRWSKLQKDFYIQDEMRFNISKIPEIYDTIRHDLSKNSVVFSNLEFDATGFLQLSKLFAYFVVSNQYGITNEQKIITAQDIATPILQKILVDLMFWKVKEYQQNFWKYQNNGGGQDWKHIRTRLYFTSASHIYSLLHLITLGNNSQLLKATPPEQVEKINKFVYMSYLSHIQFRLYQNLQMKADDPNKFRVQLTIYPDYSKGQHIQQAVLGTNGFTIDQIQNFITSVVKRKSVNEMFQLERISSKVNQIDQIQSKLNNEAHIEHPSNKQKKKEKKKNKQDKSKQKEKKKKKKKKSDSDNSKQQQ